MKKLWRGLTATMAVLLVISLTTTSVGLQYAGIINGALGLTTTVIVDEGSGGNTTYFASEFGEFGIEAQNLLVEATRQHTVSEMAEGAVLLRNENQALPLAADERSITFFGRASADPVYKNSSAGVTPKASDDSTVTLEEAFEAAGFEYNKTLMEAYAQSDVTRDKTTGEIGEVELSFYTEELKKSWKNSYHDVAIIFIARESGEGSDFFMEDLDGMSQLALHPEEKAMIEMVTASEAFGKVIVLLNTPTPIELDWLETYGIDACLWIGTPGRVGFTAVPSILTGAVNPSGKLVDTYASNSLSAPATVNSGTNSTTYTNLEEIQAGISTDISEASYVAVHPEGIYVGYKYYETRYEDVILNQGNAAAAVGASNGASTWNYADEMTYPFGYGLSYTAFRQTLDSVQDNGDGTMTAVVTVTNVGSVAGKSVVELYAQTPYGEYEKQNLVEKAAIQLIQFDKTKLLEPGQSQTLELEVDKYLLASYDYTKAKTYILSEGTYYLALGEDCHDALNNILAAKGASGMIDPQGNPVAGAADKTYSWEEAFDDVTYSTSQTTGYAITNQFDDCDLNYWVEGAVTYLSRQDWAATYPTEQYHVAATAEMISLLNGDVYVMAEDAVPISAITQGKNQGITFLDMRAVAYDDPLWDTYLDQMTIEELASQLPASTGTTEVVSVSKPDASAGDGMDNINGTLPFGDRPPANTYCSKVVLACTWSKELHQRRGELMGEECLFCGFTCVFNLGGNLHLTPFGGRNFEYISEDGTFNFYATAVEAEGMISKGVTPSIKHFAGNDQEFARKGVSTFFNEQFFREIDLRAFEGALRKAGASGLMQALHRLGVILDPQSYALNTEVLRNEWGFEGFAETDALSRTAYTNYFVGALAAGTSVYCLDSGGTSTKKVYQYLSSSGDGDMLLHLRRAVKDYHYAMVNGCGINGLSETATVRSVTPWWQILLYCLDGVFAVATAGCLVMLIRSQRKGKKGGRTHAKS